MYNNAGESRYPGQSLYDLSTSWVPNYQYGYYPDHEVRIDIKRFILNQHYCSIFYTCIVSILPIRSEKHKKNIFPASTAISIVAAKVLIISIFYFYQVFTLLVLLLRAQGFTFLDSAAEKFYYSLVNQWRHEHTFWPMWNYNSTHFVAVAYKVVETYYV